MPGSIWKLFVVTSLIITAAILLAFVDAIPVTLGVGIAIAVTIFESAVIVRMALGRRSSAGEAAPRDEDMDELVKANPGLDFDRADG